MNRKVLEAIALGVGGLVVALVLTLGAFAIAGQDISQPAGAPMFTAPPASPTSGHDDRSPEPKASKSPSKGDDHGGGDGGSGGSDDNVGSGGSDDGTTVSSGSGSNSGSSEGSGSNSGSGSGDSSDDSGGHEDD